MKKIAKKSVMGILSLVFLTSAGKGADGQNLKEIMHDLSLNLNAVHDGIMKENYETIELAAHKIAEHPKPTNARKILGIIGFDMLAFKSHDSDVHDIALGISKAAKQKNLDEVVLNTNKLVTACVSCHQGFREKVVKGMK